MNKAINIELQFFLISILWGAILLLVYDVLRILRRLMKHNEFFLALEDLIFWVAASLFIFAMMYRENNGIIRGFSVMGMLIGMVLYHYIISEWLVSIVTQIITMLFRPFSIVYHWIKRGFLFMIGKWKKVENIILKRLKNLIKSVRISLNAKKQKRDFQREDLRKKKALEKKKQEEIKQEEIKQALKLKEIAKKSAAKSKPKGKKEEQTTSKVMLPEAKPVSKNKQTVHK